MNVTLRVDVRPLLGPVRDQAERATCLAHASTTAHEHARRSAVALSPEYLHYFASAEDSSPEGIDFPSVSRALLNPGQPTETDCPYQDSEPPKTWAPPSGVTLYRRRSATSIQSPDEVEAMIEAGHTPVLGISTTEAFYEPTPPWLISATGPVRGLHAVVAVGLGTTYAMRCFLIRNSWGTDCADAGHAWLDDEFIDRHLRQVLVLTEEVT